MERNAISLKAPPPTASLFLNRLDNAQVRIHLRSDQSKAHTDFLLLQVVFYGDPFCSFNAARAPIVKPLGSCTSSDHLFSFAVECGLDASTSSKAAASSQATSSQTGSSASIPTSTSETASPPPKQSVAPGNNGGLSTSGTIAIGVVLPTVSIIVAIIFGIRMWNSGFNSRKANGFTELPMDIRTGSPPTPPTTPPLKSDGSIDGFTESGSLPPKTKEAGGKSVHPYGPEPPPPNVFSAPPRYKTNDPALMSAASIGRPREKQENNEHANHSITPTGYAELSTSNYPATRGGAAELSTSISEGFATTSLFAAQPLRTDSHSATHDNATQLPSSPRVGAGQSSAPTGYTELPANIWEGHNSSAQKGGIAELPAPPPARWR